MPSIGRVNPSSVLADWIKLLPLTFANVGLQDSIRTIAWVAREALFADPQWVCKIPVWIFFPFRRLQGSLVFCQAMHAVCKLSSATYLCIVIIIVILYEYIISSWGAVQRSRVIPQNHIGHISYDTCAATVFWIGFVLCSWFCGIGNSSWCERLFSPTLCRTGWGLR